MNKFLRLVLLMASVFIFSGATCRGPIIPVVIEPGDTAKCPAACDHLRVLGCEEGSPLEDGTTCEKFCTDTQENGQPLNPICIMTIETCAEIEGCTKAR